MSNTSDSVVSHPRGKLFNRVLLNLQRIVLTFWIGGMWAVGYLVVPVLFQQLPTPQMAGSLAGSLFILLSWSGIISALVLILIYSFIDRAKWRFAVLLLIVAFIATNAGKFSSQGVEFDLLYSPTPNWAFSLAGTYLDPLYDDFQNAPGPAGAAAAVVDRSGTRPGGIHPFSGVGTIMYNHDFGNGVDGYVRGEYLYESSTELTDAFPEIDREVNTVNASAGLSFDNNLSVQLWVRNLTEDIYFTGGFNGVAQGGTINSFYNAPRTWGGSIAYEF